MAIYFRMPGVSADSDEAVLEHWSVKTGEKITAGQVIAAVETEKAVVDVTADSDGTIYQLLCADGASMPVGDPIAIILEDGDDEAAGEQLAAKLGGSAPATTTQAADNSTQTPVPLASANQAEPSKPVATPTGQPAGSKGRIFATPLVRRLAAEQGIDLAAITGSGANGRIIRKDLEAAIAAGVTNSVPVAEPTSPAQSCCIESSDCPPRGYSGTFVAHSKVRKATAARLQSSKNTAPHFYVSATVEVDKLLQLRQQLNQVSPVKISVNDLVVKAAALALTDIKEVNVLWTEEGSWLLDTVDISVAVATERGLLTPVIRNVDQISLSKLASLTKDAAARAGEGKLRQDELEGGSMTVTNMGMFDVEDFAAIINPPQTSILAVSAAKDSVVVHDGAIAVAKTMKLTLSMDHRPVDGVTGAKYMRRLKEILENPMVLTV